MRQFIYGLIVGVLGTVLISFYMPPETNPIPDVEKLPVPYGHNAFVGPGISNHYGRWDGGTRLVSPAPVPMELYKTEAVFALEPHMIDAICASFVELTDPYSNTQGIRAGFDFTLTDEGTQTLRPMLQAVVDQKDSGRPFGLRLDYLDFGLVGLHSEGFDYETALGTPYVFNMSVRPFHYLYALQLIENHYGTVPSPCDKSGYGAALKERYETQVVDIQKKREKAIKEAMDNATSN